MDEPEMRRYISSLCKELMPEFAKTKDPKEWLRLALGAPVPEQLSEEHLKDGIKKAWPRKNASLATKSRDDGNTAFQNNNHDLAVTLYTEAMKYSPVDEALKEGQMMAIAAANRSASYFQLRCYPACLTDIDLALEAGYPNSIVYKLYIRQCKCLLELGRIPEAQAAFDRAIDAIDRSGLKKDVRKGMAVNLQEAFINLAKTIEDCPEKRGSTAEVGPEWTQLRDPHPNYPSASSAIRIEYDPHVGRHVVAGRTIEAGEVLFKEQPLVSVFCQDKGSEDNVLTPSCHQCLRYIQEAALVPCPTCHVASFCSIRCRNLALNSHHRYECKLSNFLEESQLNRLPLVMIAFRAVTQKDLTFFLDEARKGTFETHNPQNGVGLDGTDTVFASHDYRNLFNLVTHTSKREAGDVVTKYLFACVLVRCLEAVDYFKDAPDLQEAVSLIAKLLEHFLEAFQFNTHMIESVYTNRVIAPDSETRMWKDAEKFVIGEFVETHQLGGGIYPTMANVNHSCDPNLTIINQRGKHSVAVALRRIEAGEELHDTYGAVYYHMDKEDRQKYIQASHWFLCKCKACSNDWPVYARLPRGYLKLPGTYFKFKRCNRKELQKDVDRIKAKIQGAVNSGSDQRKNQLEDVRQMYLDLGNLLEELLIPPGHQDFVNVRRGLRNCMWLQEGSNTVKVREDATIREARRNYKGRRN